jgi:acyl-CoA thioesterase
MSLMSIQKKIIGKMYENDAFSQWLGIEIIEAETGNCKLKMAVRDEMCFLFS